MGVNLDERLYNDYLNGETDAFELLYDKYKSSNASVSPFK